MCTLVHQRCSSRADLLLGVCEISNLVKISREPCCTRLAMTDAITGELRVEQWCSVTRVLASPANVVGLRIRGRTIRQSRRPRVPQSGPGRSANCNIGGSSTQFPYAESSSKRVIHSWETRPGSLLTTLTERIKPMESCRDDVAECVARALLENR